MQGHNLHTCPNRPKKKSSKGEGKPDKGKVKAEDQSLMMLSLDESGDKITIDYVLRTEIAPHRQDV